MSIGDFIAIVIIVSVCILAIGFGKFEADINHRGY